MFLRNVWFLASKSYFLVRFICYWFWKTWKLYQKWCVIYSISYLFHLILAFAIHICGIFADIFLDPQVSVRIFRSANVGPQVQVRKCRSALRAMPTKLSPTKWSQAKNFGLFRFLAINEMLFDSLNSAEANDIRIRKVFHV